MASPSPLTASGAPPGEGVTDRGWAPTPAEGGRVSIGWTREADRLHLIWRESGGPPVEPPSRSGFGSRLIERGLAADLGGNAALRFEPAGLRCDIEASLAAIRAPERAPERAVA